MSGDAESEPRSRLDVIYRHLLGECNELFTRAENLLAAVTEWQAKIEEAGARVEAEIDQRKIDAETGLRLAGDRVEAEFEKKVVALTGELAGVVNVVTGASRRLVVGLMVLAILSGLVGGALAVLAVRFWVMGGA